MHKFKNVLFIVSTDCPNGTALGHSVTLATKNQARLTLVKVIDEIPPDQASTSEGFKGKILAEHLMELEKLAESKSSQIEIETRVLTGTPVMEIIRTVLDKGYDLVVKPAQSGDLPDRLFGNDDMQLLRACPCPLWLINTKSSKSYRRILAAVDVGYFYSPEELETIRLLNLQILEISGAMALSENAGLDVAHAMELFGQSAERYDNSDEYEVIGEIALNIDYEDTPKEKPGVYAAEVRQKHRQNMNALIDETIGKLEPEVFERINPEAHLIFGSPRKKIPEFVNQLGVDLVVMGTVNHTGIDEVFIGNTAETIFKNLNCSVLAIKPPGFETPVTLESSHF